MIKMKTRKIKLYSLLLVCVWCIQSCTDGFEEMNKDPKNPTQTSLPAMFNGIVQTLQLGYNEMAAIHFGRYYYQSQQLGNAMPTYPLTGGADNIWSNYYMALKDMRLLETRLTDGTMTSMKTDNAKACLDILLAYKTLRMVDYVGDMPFFDAGKGSEGSEFFKVKYDKQQDIYKYCIDLLKAAGANLKNESGQYSYGTGDTFFKGDINLWKKFANSLVLRYALQAANADATTYTPIIGEIMSNPSQYPLFTSIDVAAIWPGGNLFDSHPWSFRESNNSCMGTAMWKMMSENDNTDGSGIFDPRCYVFFEPNVNGEWKAYPQSPTDNTPVQDRGPYLTSTYNEKEGEGGRGRGANEQEWAKKGVGCRFSPVNFYLATNDDYIPEIIMTAAEVYFLQAEIYNRGIGVTKNADKAKNAYIEGIKSSLTFWYDKIVTPCNMWVMHKPSLTLDKIDKYLAKTAYSSTEATALSQIYAQIWIDSFRQPWVGFNLYRRTLATPRDTSGPYNPANYNFYKVPYSESESLYNQDNYKAATGGNNVTDKKLFWHK